MALITCPDCHREVSDQAVACPQCGRPIARARVAAEDSQGQPASVSFTCPKCKNTMSVPERYAGRQLKCTTCGSPFQVGASPAGARKPSRVEERPQASTPPGAAAGGPSQGFQTFIGGLVVLFLLLYIVGRLTGVYGSGSSGTASDRSSRATTTPKSTFSVKYRVTGSGTSKADVTFENATGDTTQMGDVSLPWEFDLGTCRGGTFLYIAAQNQEEQGCVKTCLVVDGVQMQENQSCGEYVIATSSGRL